MQIAVSETHARKAESSISRSSEGGANATDASDEQSLKQYRPMLSTEVGMQIEESETQCGKT
jgi:hypothetical protein